MPSENLRFQKTDAIMTITLDRHPANTLNRAMLLELDAAFDAVEKDAATRVVILTGAGDRFFCGGADLKELRSGDLQEFAERGQQVFRRIEILSKPVIVALNGSALGGGCELAVSGHLRYAADTARLGQPEINFGMMPAWGGTQRLPRLVGRTQALMLLLTGQIITVNEAEHIGLINRVLPAAELSDAVFKLAQHLAAAPPLAVKEILACVDTGLEEGLQRGLDAERTSFGWISQTEDASIGIHAFLNKQKATFKGR